MEASSVNKRNLETLVSLPRDWQALEREALSLARKMIARGRVSVTIRARSIQPEEIGCSWDENRLSDDLDRLSSFAKKKDIPFEPDAALLAHLATSQKAEHNLPGASQMKKGLRAALQEALEAMVATRIEEGERLSTDLASRTAKLAGYVEDLAKASEGISAAWRVKLLDRLRQADLEIEVEDERVLREIALFADRCDVSEEITRLRSHEELLKHIFEEGGSVGRKLEFALQEVSRELNTVASKSPSVEVKRLVIDARAEVEKMREQALNVE